ncbi:MAG: type IX secretion system protein PorQ [Bacteroidetes bacterium]|nr:type IX secretion system protein PorQ [Bacteroidota bacterium]
MILNRVFVVFFLFVSLVSLYGQRGTSIFSFTQLSPSARLTGLGQHGTALMDADPLLSRSNPAALSPEIDWTAGAQFGALSPGIQFGQAFLANRSDKADLQWLAGASFVNFGEFISANPMGVQTGNFKARDLSFFLGLSKKVYERLYAGMSVEFLQSELAEFSSSGMAAHIGLMYWVEEKQFTVGMAWRNMGWQWSSYDIENEAIRSQLNLAISKRLKHLPLRFSLIYHNMNRWNLLYDSPIGEESSTIGEIAEDEEKSEFGLWMDNFSRHLAVNAEFFIGKKEQFRLRLGYDHQRRQELRLPNWGSLAGFSGGFGLVIRGISFDYGFGAYHLAGGLHHIGISAPLSRKKKLDIL